MSDTGKQASSAPPINPEGMPRMNPSGKSSWLAILKVSFAVIALALVAALIWQLRKTTKDHVNVAVMTWAGAGPGFVAREHGLFYGLDVNIAIIDDTKARQAAYQSPDYEVMLTNPDQRPIERSSGLPGSMILLSDVSNGADGMLVNPRIRTISGLKGKRIAYARGTASELLLVKALESVGVKPTDVKLTIVDDPGIAAAALTAGQVDAAMSWDPTKSAKEAHQRILFTSRDFPGIILGVFVAKTSLTSDKDRLRRFLNGWLSAVDLISKEPQHTYGEMAKAFKVSPNEMAKMIEGLRLADRAMNVDYFSPLPGKQTTKLEEFTNWASQYWIRNGMLKESLSNEQSQWLSPEIRAFYER